jgi:hypothetical protein
MAHTQAGIRIVGRSGDDVRSERLQQQSHLSNGGKCRHEQLRSMYASCGSRRESAHNPTWRAV